MDSLRADCKLARRAAGWLLLVVGFAWTVLDRLHFAVESMVWNGLFGHSGISETDSCLLCAGSRVMAPGLLSLNGFKNAGALQTVLHAWKGVDVPQASLSGVAGTVGFSTVRQAPILRGGCNLVVLG